MKRLLRRPSPGTVLGALALFVALGGVAGALPGQNSVDNGDVKDLKYKDLPLQNGWGSFSSFSYSPGAAIDAQGVVHLRGAVAQPVPGDETIAQVKEPYRPEKDVYVPIDISSGNQGRLYIDRTGLMDVTAEDGEAQATAQNFTSLDGVTYEGG